MEQEPEVEKSSLVFTGRGSPSRKTSLSSGSVGVTATVAVGGGVLVGAGGSVGAAVGIGTSVAACPQAVSKTAKTIQITFLFIALFRSLNRRFLNQIVK
jgi:hypothetical protein